MLIDDKVELVWTAEAWWRIVTDVFETLPTRYRWSAHRPRAKPADCYGPFYDGVRSGAAPEDAVIYAVRATKAECARWCARTPAEQQQIHETVHALLLERMGVIDAGTS